MKIINTMEISKLGFGAWAIGGVHYGSVAMDDIFAVLDVYREKGGNFIDTAQSYGESEKVLGMYLKERDATNSVIIATKSDAGEELNSLDRLEKAVYDSLEKLQREYIDIYYLHSPPSDAAVMDKALHVLEKFKAQGIIKAIGASIKGVDVTDDTVKMTKEYIDSKRVDVIQLAYSIFRQKNAQMFDYAYENNVAIVGRTSLESGFLTGKFQKNNEFVQNDHRNRWGERKNFFVEHADELKELMLKNNWDNSLLSLSLRFAIVPTAITSTIVGAKNKDQMEEIFTAFEKISLQNEILYELKKKYAHLNDNFNTK